MTAPAMTDVIVDVPDEAARKLARNAPHSFSNMGSDSPLLRIGGVLYVGTVERIVGTHLLFDASRKRSAGYVGAATVRIVFEEQASAKGSRRKRRAPADRDGENTAPIAENDGRGKGAAKTGAADKVPDEELKQSAVDADKSA